MPRRRFNRKRKKGSRKRRTLTISAHQARTKAYDSRVEKIMARVARQEDAKNQIRLIYRQYLFGGFNVATNIFTAGTLLHSNGFVVPLARVQKLDIATVGSTGNFPAPFQTPTTWVTPGPNVLAPINGRDGFRLGDWIKIHGISLSMRIRASLLNLTTVPIPLYEHVHVYWKLCAALYEGQEVANAKPDAEDLLKIPRFGYSSKLDTAQAMLTETKRVKTFASGHIKMQVKSQRPEVMFMNKYVSLSKNPLKVEYEAFDQNGVSCLRWKPYFVIRSQIPDNPAYLSYQPLINVCTKIHYIDT